MTHRRDDARSGRAVDSSAEWEEESALTTAAQIVPQPACRTHPETIAQNTELCVISMVTASVMVHSHWTTLTTEILR